MPNNNGNGTVVRQPAKGVKDGRLPFRNDLTNTMRRSRDLVIRWLFALLMCNCAIGHAAAAELTHVEPQRTWTVAR